jgi:hypothetical protein
MGAPNVLEPEDPTDEALRGLDETEAETRSRIEELDKLLEEATGWVETLKKLRAEARSRYNALHDSRSDYRHDDGHLVRSSDLHAPDMTVNHGNSELGGLERKRKRSTTPTFEATMPSNQNQDQAESEAMAEVETNKSLCADANPGYNRGQCSTSPMIESVEADGGASNLGKLGHMSRRASIRQHRANSAPSSLESITSSLDAKGLSNSETTQIPQSQPISVLMDYKPWIISPDDVPRDPVQDDQQRDGTTIPPVLGPTTPPISEISAIGAPEQDIDVGEDDESAESDNSVFSEFGEYDSDYQCSEEEETRSDRPVGCEEELIKGGGDQAEWGVTSCRRQWHDKPKRNAQLRVLNSIWGPHWRAVMNPDPRECTPFHKAHR